MPKPKAMTEGNALSQILSFAMPLLLGNLFQQTYNLADSAIVGQTLGARALGSVGLSSSVQFLVLGFCLGSMTGFAIPVASSFGARREREMRRYVYNGAILAAGIALVLTIVTAVLTPQILKGMQAPSELYSDGVQYLRIIFLGLPATILYNFLSAILRAVGDSRTPFFFLAFSSVLNVFLDLFCIQVLHWGVAGAAAATVFAQAVSGVLCWILIRRKFEVLYLAKEDKVFERQKCRILLNMGLPMGFQYSITAIGSMTMQAANNSLGTVYVSGFAAGVKIKQFAMSPFDALSSAMATFVSQNYGARHPDRIKKGIHLGCRLAVLYGIGIGLVLILFGKNLCLLFLNTSEEAMLAAGAQYLRALGWFYWVLGLLCVLRLSLQGIGWSQRAVFAGVLEMAARVFVSVVFVPKFGYGGICVADQAAWIAATLYLIPTLHAAIRETERELT